jgi:hypothetical protein
LSLQTHGSGGLIRIEQGLGPHYLVTQQQTPLFQSAHQKLIKRAFSTGTINHGIQITMLNAEFYQSPFGRMQVGVQGVSKKK